MSFCGTIEHERRWRMLGFFMHCSALASQLLDLKYKRAHDKSKDDEGQMRLFHMTTEQREDFAKFAANIRFLITPWTNETSEGYWKECYKHEYHDYDFQKLFDPFYREKTEAVVLLLEKAGRGEELTEEETRTAMEFLHMLGGRAHALTHHGGCF